ncbi:family 2 encapsulin nanocompartment cargo protein terpene cyclase [Pseudonocardia acaciae]|uniref:family 2 encapsulin nanocompartment cargo protein terpene cyclase n=1 Tax=Pseudonocardia acaciae TaxID=551276 RepID=UPI00068741CF|nr:family 2 encapsulin nanocompartment cargo protein terpene cyclase [Pseudonocardia acaciae]
MTVLAAGTDILADMTGAPSTDLSALLAADGAGAEAAVPSTVRRFASGVGMAGLRFPRLLTEPSPSPSPEPSSESEAEDDDSMPELFCPGPIRDDPALGEEVNERLVDWAEEIGIYEGRLDKLRACNFGRLIMLTHPATDDPDRLLAATKCVVAEWAADDYYVDEVSLGADPKVVGSRLAKLHAIVDPAPLPARYAPQLDAYRDAEPIATAFRTAMEHLARYTTASQLGRFQHQMSILYVAWNQEADWHANGRTPPVWEYLVQRHLNSYLPPMILIDVLAGYELPSVEFFDPRVRRAFTMAGDANVLLNDLHSGAAESENDFNLPRVIAAEEKCTPREAIKRTVEIHNELMHKFVEEAGALSVVGSPMLRRFFADTWAWLGGSREWHATTARYHQ